MFNSNSLEINSFNEENQNKNYIEEIKYLMGYIISQNNKNKQYKKALYRIRGFEPYKLFNEIDNLSSGYLNLSDLKEFLDNNNIVIEKDIILLFLREFNKKENDNNLNMQDFFKFLNYDIDKNEIKIGELDFDKNEIKKNFINLLKSEFNLIKEKNEFLNEIKKIREFSTYEAFYKISNDKKYIDYDCLKTFLGDLYKKNEINELIYRLDMNNDGKINYEEFQDLFFPFQEHLHLEEANDDYNYNSNNGNENEKNYNISINDNYNYNLNPYKDNKLTEPRIINNYNFNDDDTNNYDDDNSKSDIFLSTNSFNKEINNEINSNFKENNNGYINNNKYDNDNFIIKYDKELINEINERLKEKNKGNFNFENQKNENHNNEIKNKENQNNEIKKDKKYLDSINIHGSIIFDDYNSNDNNNENKLDNVDENNNSKSDIFLSKIKSEENNNSKSDIFISQNKSEVNNNSKSDIFLSNNKSEGNNNSKSDIFLSNNKSEENKYYKTDIFPSNNISEGNSNYRKDFFLSYDNINKNQHLINNQNNINNINNTYNNFKENVEKNEKSEKIENSSIFTEQEQAIINLFIDYIHSIIILENKTENIRESICLCDDINLLKIYEKFDENRNNLISKIDFKNVCNKEYYIFPTDDQIKLIFKRFDLDNDEYLNFDEFMNMISPLKKEYLGLCRKDENDNNFISFESKKKVIDFFKTLINNESFIYEIKSNLISQKNFNFIYLWGILMKFSQDNEKLTEIEFNNFLENFKCFLTQFELDLIFLKLANGKNEMKYNDLYKEIII